MYSHSLGMMESSQIWFTKSRTFEVSMLAPCASKEGKRGRKGYREMRLSALLRLHLYADAYRTGGFCKGGVRHVSRPEDPAHHRRGPVPREHHHRHLLEARGRPQRRRPRHRPGHRRHPAGRSLVHPAWRHADPAQRTGAHLGGRLSVLDLLDLGRARAVRPLGRDLQACRRARAKAHARRHPQRRSRNLPGGIAPLDVERHAGHARALRRTRADGHEAMSLENILLGILKRPAAGYDIKRQFETVFNHFWHADLTQIYRALNRMEKDGLLESRLEPSERGPARKVYQRTPAGSRTLAEWLRGGPVLGNEKFAYLAQIHFLDEIEPA